MKKEILEFKRKNAKLTRKQKLDRIVKRVIEDSWIDQKTRRAYFDIYNELDS